jgi:polyadenylation factor subunit 2
MGVPPPQFQNGMGAGGPVGGGGQNGGVVLGADGVRRRAPLPDQNEALLEEMRQGRYRKAR